MYWLLDRYDLTIPIAFPGSVEVDWELLPPFYCALSQAWTALQGSLSPTAGFSFGPPPSGWPFSHFECLMQIMLHYLSAVHFSAA